MQKCYYHAKTAAVTSCVGCKMPVCAMCRDEGAKGLCDQCVRKQASVSEPAKGAKAQAPGGRTAAAPSGRTVGGPTPRTTPGQRSDVVYCFRHQDIRGERQCVTCARHYCPACLNTSGICGVCARVNKDAQARAFGPNEKGRAVFAEMEAAKASKRLKPRDYIVVGCMVLGLVVSYKVMTQKPAKVDTTRETLEHIKNSEFSADELALLARLKSEKRVKLSDPVPAAGAAGGAASSGGGAATLPAGGGAAAAAVPLEIRAVAPADGTIVGGTTSIRAAVAGAPTRVVCEVDGTLIGSDAGAAPRFSWNTRAAGNGSHNVTITAFNGSGSTSTTFSLNVLNR